MYAKFHFAPDDPGGSGSGPDDSPPDDSGSGNQPPEGSGSGAQDDLVSREELSKLNREAAKYRRERNELRERLKDIEDAEKSEVERLKGQVATLTENLSKTQAGARELRVQVLAERVGISPDARQDASKLLDWDKVVDPDSDAILEDALKQLVKDRPYLLSATGGGADGGAGGDGSSLGAGMNAQIRRAAGRT